MGRTPAGESGAGVSRVGLVDGRTGAGDRAGG